jgi:hypothetical protein
MKKLIALTLLLCLTPLLAWGDNAADALSLQIKITRGERSKDSNASTVSLTLSGQKLVYTISGRRMGGRAVAPREFKLTAEDKTKLIRLIKDRKLLRTDSIERPRDASESGIYFYFELSIKATINGSEGLINIKGSRKANALQNEKLYKDAAALIEELYSIMGRADSDMVYQPLIN